MAEAERSLEPALVPQGVSEFVFGASCDRKQPLLDFWAVLGFTPEAEGSLSADQAHALYGHASALTSIRLHHRGCDTFNTGRVRLQFWDQLKNEGLGNTRPIAPGSRWMGLYCRDILQARDAFTARDSMANWNLWVSPLVNAPLANPPPRVTFYEPFVGLRETLVFGDEFRIALIQRGGFDRPGFGTFNEDLLFKNTEGSHASMVQAPNAFDSAFYKSVFGFESAPFGEQHTSGGEAPTIEALRLKPGELFEVERLRAPKVPSGILQLYSSQHTATDRRPLSRAGCRNLSVFSIQASDLGALRDRALENGASAISDLVADEFGHPSLTFDARDGLQWIATSHVG